MDALVVHNNSQKLLCNPTESILCIINLQKKIIESMPERVKRKLICKTQEMLEVTIKLDIPVIVCEQSPQILGGMITEVYESLPEDTFFMERTNFSCCEENEFLNLIRRTGRNQIILTGLEAHISVLQTAIGLSGDSYDVFLVEDNVASRVFDNFMNGLKRMSQSGIILTNTESVMTEWGCGIEQYVSFLDS